MTADSRDRWRQGGDGLNMASSTAARQATCSHPVIDSSLFSNEQQASRDWRSSWPWATSTRQASGSSWNVPGSCDDRPGAPPARERG